MRDGDAAPDEPGQERSSGPPKTRPCLDSVTAEVFYFLEQRDQRTLL